MFRKVVLTFSTRILTALLSVVNVLIGTNFLGGEGFGTISLIILGISIYLLIQNLLGGSPVIYFMSKMELSSVMIIAYLWALVSIGLFSSIIFIAFWTGEKFGWNVEIVPIEFAGHNIALAACYGFTNLHQNVLLGKERLKAYNFIFLLQHVITTIVLLVLFLGFEKDQITDFLTAMYVSYIISMIIAFSLSFKYVRTLKRPQWTQFKTMIRYGFFGQSANVFQMLNYRLSYYLIDAFIGRASLGIFAAATQISEGLWIFGKSIATVQFARIANSNDKDYAIYLTRQLLKFTLFITAVPLIIIIFIPVEWIEFFLGEQFGAARSVIRWMAPGTITLATSMMLSHYFSGTGKIHKNTVASGTGVITTVGLGIILIPQFGITGAALVSSASYITSFIYLFFQFKKEQPIRLHHMLIRLSDIRESVLIIKGQFKGKPR